MTSVCFTGHRKIDSSDMYALKSLLDSTICGLVKRGVTDFYCGGALGFAAASTLAGNLTLLGSVANLIVAEIAADHPILKRKRVKRDLSQVIFGPTQ